MTQSREEAQGHKSKLSISILCIPSGDLMGGSYTHQGYDREFFLLAESHDHSTMNCIMAAIGGFG